MQIPSRVPIWEALPCNTCAHNSGAAAGTRVRDSHASAAVRNAPFVGMRMWRYCQICQFVISSPLSTASWFALVSIYISVYTYRWHAMGRESSNHIQTGSHNSPLLWHWSHMLCAERNAKAATSNTSQFRSIESPLRRFTIRDSLVRASLYLDTAIFIDVWTD